MIEYKKSLNDITLYKAGKSALPHGGAPIKLSSNENAYGASPMALYAYRQAAENIYKYPDGSAKDLKQALCEHYDINYDHIICGAGSDNILELLSLCFVDKGDVGIFSANSFPVYEISIRAAGGIPIKLPYRDDLSVDIQAIIAACNEKTKIVFIASPDNPTGCYVPIADIHRLMKAVPPHILVVIDEAYYEFCDADDYQSALPLVHEYPNIAVTRTFSKMFGLAALRVGWGYMPLLATKALDRVRSPFNVSLPAQAAAIAALKDTDWQKDNIHKNITQRHRFKIFLKENNFRYIPSQANFTLINFADAQKVNQYLLDHNIIIRHVVNNNMPDYLRMSMGTADQMDFLMKVLNKIDPLLK